MHFVINVGSMHIVCKKGQDDTGYCYLGFRCQTVIGGWVCYFVLIYHDSFICYRGNMHCMRLDVRCGALAHVRLHLPVHCG